jgi:hypothetical protein
LTQIKSSAAPHAHYPQHSEANTMSRIRSMASWIRARKADRLYGELLVLLAVMSAFAPLFVGATLAWAMLLAGAAGLWWIGFDRTPHGLMAGAAWALIALGLGLHLTFHVLLDVVPLELTLGCGFVLLGLSEFILGLERYRPGRPARIAMMAGGGAAVLFGVMIPMIWPDIPSWAAAGALSIVLGTFGVAVLIGAPRGMPQQLERPPREPERPL